MIKDEVDNVYLKTRKYIMPIILSLFICFVGVLCARVLL